LTESEGKSLVVERSLADRSGGNQAVGPIELSLRYRGINRKERERRISTVPGQAQERNKHSLEPRSRSSNIGKMAPMGYATCWQKEGFKMIDPCVTTGGMNLKLYGDGNLFSSRSLTSQGVKAVTRRGGEEWGPAARLLRKPPVRET